MGTSIIHFLIFRTKGRWKEPCQHASLCIPAATKEEHTPNFRTQNTLGTAYAKRAVALIPSLPIYSDQNLAFDIFSDQNIAFD